MTLQWSEPGKGSCFRVRLPLRRATGAVDVSTLEAIRAESMLASSTAAPLSGRILLVEDRVVNQRLIAFLLRKAGAEVDVADNGRMALEMLERAEATVLNAFLDQSAAGIWHPKIVDQAGQDIGKLNPLVNHTFVK